MRTVFVAIALFAASAWADESVPGLQLKFGSPREQTLKLSITHNDQPLATDFDAFLGQVLTHFDRDRDGSWNEAEAARVFSFPTASGKTATLKFSEVDTNSDGRVQLGELQTWCKQQSILPLVEVATSPIANDAHLSKIFSTVLDPDHDGRITQTDLQATARRMQRFDLNDDEILELKELLAAVNVAGDVKFADDATILPESLALQINFGDKPTTSLPRETAVHRLSHSGNRFLLQGGSKAMLVTGRLQRDLPAMETLTEFLVAQLEEAASGENGLKSSVVTGNETLRALQDLFPFADQDGNEQLTSGELRSYLTLLASGVRSQVAVKLHNRGWNLFPYLDTDGDQRLTPSELTRLRDLPLQVRGEPPHCWELEFGTLPVTTWGGVHLPASAKTKPKPATKPNLPGWFQAQDRNGDGVVSVREFLGPVSRFRALDANGDELLDLAEVTSNSEMP